MKSTCALVLIISILSLEVEYRKKILNQITRIIKMSNEDNEKTIETLVVDSSVLIKRAPLKDLTDRVYAVPGVVAEIKDENTRASLQVLPYDFKLKEASSDAIKFGSL